MHAADPVHGNHEPLPRSPVLAAERRSLRWYLGFALAVIGAAAFAGTLRCGFTSWDDNRYVTENPTLGDLSFEGLVQLFTSFEHCNYHPLTVLSYRIEYALSGLDPALYHFDNLVLHLVAGILAFRLLLRWLGAEIPAFLGAAFFLIHPLKVESVVWISERKDVLSAVFYLGALLAYPELPTRGRYLASLALFVCALLSKVMAVSLPFALLLVAIAERRPLRRELLLLLPFFAFSALFTGLGIAAQAADEGLYGLHGGRLSTHLLCLPLAIAHYAEKLCLPILLSPRYYPKLPEGLLDIRVLAGLALAAVAGMAVWRSFRFRGPAFLGLSFFAVAWAPVSGLVASSTLVADRYLYIPSMGLSLALFGSIHRSLRSGVSARVHAGRLAHALTVASVLAYAFLTPLQVELWRNSLALWTHALEENPRNAIAHNQISVVHFEAGRYAEAAAYATESVRHGLTQPRFLYNVCVAYRGIGHLVREFETAREIVRGMPGFLPAHLVILRHLRREGRFAEHRRLLAELEQRFPREPGLVMARGEAEEAQGNVRAALDLFIEAVRRRPSYVEARFAASVALARLGAEEEAASIALRSLPKQGKISDIGAQERLRQLVALLERSERPEVREAASRLRQHFVPVAFAPLL